MIVKQVRELKESDLKHIKQVYINKNFVEPIECKLDANFLLVEYFNINTQRVATTYLTSNDIVHIKR